MAGTAARNRTRARRAALQALYQWQLTGEDPREVVAQFVSERPMGDVDLEYFHLLLESIPAELEALDHALAPKLDRPLAQLDPVERAILRIGAFELAFRPDVPWRVVINEAIELAKVFGAEQSHRYINGVLDRIAREARAAEVEAR